MGFKFEEVGVYASPVYFGPKPWEIDYERMRYRLHQPPLTEELTVTFETDPAKLECLLPDGFTLNEPLVSVMAEEYNNIGWLAGRSYRILQYSIPAHWNGPGEEVDGDFLLALWENHCDPVVGGREGLGYCKIYCAIPEFVKLNGVYTVTASSWDFRFVKMQLFTDKPAKDPERFNNNIERSGGKMNFKYIPGTGKPEPDAAYPVFNPKWVKPDDYEFEMVEPQITVCDASIEHYRPEWEDMPTYAHVAQGFASWEVKSVIGARHRIYSNPCDFSHSRILK